MAYYLRLDHKKRGTYLQMYDRYWDKEKKQARSKSIQAFGYLEDLISDELPDPVAYYKEFVKRKNEERAASLAQENRPRAFSSPLEFYLGHFLLHTLLEELGVKETIDILAGQFFRIFTTAPPSQRTRFTTVWPLSALPTKNTLSSLTIVMNSTIKEISAAYFLTVRIIILGSTCPAETGRKGPRRRTGMIRSSGRPFFSTQTWYQQPCRCTRGINRKSLTSGRPLKK